MYRLFVRDAASGQFLKTLELDRCQTDRDALSRLADHSRGAAILELWDERRLVATVNPPKPTPTIEPAFDMAAAGGYFI